MLDPTTQEEGQLGPRPPDPSDESQENAHGHEYVDVRCGQSCYTEEVQSQEAGLTRPVLVTII